MVRCNCCDAVAYHLTKAMVKHACKWFWLFILALLILTGVTMPFVNVVNVGDDDWTIAEHMTSVNKDAINSAKSQVDGSSNSKKEVREREIQDSEQSILFLYDWTDKNQRENEGNIFTPSNLQKICQIEHILIEDSKYPDYCQLKYLDDNSTDGCVQQQTSIASMFYLPIRQKFDKECPLLDADKVEGIAKCNWYLPFANEEDTKASVQWCNCWRYRQSPLGSKCDDTCSNCKIPNDKKYDSSLSPEMKKKMQQQLGNFLSSEIKSQSPPSSGLTRSILNLGSPLFKDGKQLTAEEAEEEQKQWLLDIEAKLFDRFGMVHFVVSSAYLQVAEADGMRVRFFNNVWFFNEFNLLLTSDMSWLGGSVAFVFIYMRIHTGSYFLAFIGIFQIIFSLPVSLFFYRHVFQIEYFAELHILALFLVLGVGADDIFVLVDAWKQSIDELKDTDKEESENGYKYESPEHERLAFAFKRASLAVFNTSFTTCMAFLATAISPLMPISTFGIFAATCIFMNYIFTVFFSPVVVIIWHRFWELKNCCCCCADKPWCKCMFWCAKASTRTSQTPKELSVTNEIAVAPLESLNEATLIEKNPKPALITPSLPESPLQRPIAETNQTAQVVSKGGDSGDNESENHKRNPNAKCCSGCSFESCFGGCFFNLMAFRVLGSSDPIVQKHNRLNNGVMGTGLFTTNRIVLTPEYNREVSKGRRCLPLLSLLLILILSTVAGLSFWQASKLTPPRTAEKWLPPNHMMQMTIEDLGDGFYAGESDAYTLFSITWGVKDVDRSEFNRYYPNEKRGDAVFDSKFAKIVDFGSPESSNHTHHALKQVCEIVDKFRCEGLLGDMLAYPGSVYDKDHPENCWPHYLEDLMQKQGREMPGSSQEAYGTHLSEFRTSIGSADQNIGIIDGELKFLSLTFRGGLRLFSPAKTSRIAYECGKKLQERISATLDDQFAEGGFDGLDNFKIMAGGRWVDMYMSESLVTGLFTGLAICFPVAAVVLLLSSGNIFIAMYAVGCIASIVGFVLGFCKWAMNWDLGTAQSVAGVIVIGFSVDYCVHLAHMYTEAHSRTARGRSQHALATMGGTVFGGAITTFGSGAFLFPCQITFFTTMSWLISMTILGSLAYSLGMFMALCILLGPNDNIGNIYCCCKKKKQ